MLRLASRRAVTSKILYPNSNRSSGSTLKVVVFGSSSQVVPFLATHLNSLGAFVTFPCRTSYKYIDYIKPAFHYRTMHIQQFVDYNDPDIIAKIIKENNVVINLIGAHAYLKNYDFIYEGNVTMAKRIAEACAASPDVVRLIHVSAAGADPAAASTRLSTKWLGEQEVKKAYPSATIIRPCTIFGEFDYFVTKLANFQQWLGFNFLIDEGAEKRQPINSADVATCLFNAIRLPETAGQTYELGGPHVYSQKEILEIIYNKLNRPPVVKSFPYEKTFRVMRRAPHFWALTRWLTLNEVLESRTDIVVSKGAKTCEDLFVKPISFPQNLKAIASDWVAKNDVSLEDNEHGWYNGNDRKYEP